MILCKLTLRRFHVSDLIQIIVPASIWVESVPLLGYSFLILVDVRKTALGTWGSRHASAWCTTDVSILVGVILMALIFQASQEVLSSWIQIWAREWSRGCTHELINQRSIWWSVSCFAIDGGLNGDWIMTMMIGVTSKTSLSSVYVIRCSWWFVW